MLQQFTKESTSTLLEQCGIEPCVAATLLVTAGGNQQRLGKESAFAVLCEMSSLQASSGQTSRNRLSRRGAREDNNALWTAVLIRMRSDLLYKIICSEEKRRGTFDKRNTKVFEKLYCS
ncbi:transposase [Vibrio celticus]|uniref:transposase n=1 Tax=Vibrio celticus TaxID=446372 RepID=UPI00080F78C8